MNSFTAMLTLNIKLQFCNKLQFGIHVPKSFVYTIFQNSSSDSCKIIPAQTSSEWSIIAPLIARQVTNKSQLANPITLIELITDFH